jgi:integrase
VAKVSRRLGRLGVDYVDEAGKRRWKSFKTEEQAQVFLGRMLVQTGKPASTDPSVTMMEYAPRWLAVAAIRVKPTSLTRYRRVIEHQILPSLGLHAVRAITTPMLRDWIARLLVGPKKPLKKSTAAQVLEVTRQILDQAVDDRIIDTNPARGLTKKLRLTSKALGHDVKAMSPEQLDSFLKAAEIAAPEWRFAYLILAYTGMRLGEAFGLRWSDVNVEQRQITVERQAREDGEIGLPKSQRSRRTIRVGPALLQAIHSERTKRKAKSLRAGGALSPWVIMDWPDDGPTMEAVISARNAIRYAMKTVLKRAKLPAHFTPHSFRHTYASILLSRGEPILSVSQTLGHETLAITADLYGRWLRSDDTNAAESLERLIGAK